MKFNLNFEHFKSNIEKFGCSFIHDKNNKFYQIYHNNKNIGIGYTDEEIVYTHLVNEFEVSQHDFIKYIKLKCFI